MSKVYNYSLAEIKEKITNHGMKCTSQRIAIYQALLSSDHPSAEEVYDDIEKDFPSISLSTVYNTLETFAETKLIGKIKTSNGKMRYDVRIEPHAHLYCKKSEKAIDYFDDELQEMIIKHIKKKKIPNFNIGDIQIQINGKLINN